MTTRTDKKFMQRAIDLALSSEQEGNLPVGSVITLDGQIIGEGKSSVLEPEYDPGRHAEIEAIGQVDTSLWPRADEMTCYTTLEPCVMCAGTLLLHGVGRVVFGANDTLGGAGCVLDHLPPYYDEGGVYDWVGPLMPKACDPLYERADEAFAELPVGRDRWSPSKRDEKDADETPTATDHLDTLDAWRASPRNIKLRDARKAAAAYAKQVDDELIAEVLPYAQAIFERTGYLKDFRSLKRLAKRAGELDALDQVDQAIRENLPDVWIKRALKQGDQQGALGCWYEHEDHRRARHCADKLIAACGEDDAELLISCRMSIINYLIGRRARRHYRKACAVLRKLRDELTRAGQEDYWKYVLEDIRTQYDTRPALLDELEKAGFIASTN
jgi:tRNA(adenine34) deaminase